MRLMRRRALAVVGLLVTAGTVWQASYASFADGITSPGNSWETGAVTLTDSAGGSALFAGYGTGLAPGPQPSRCIEVTYGGDVAADVRLYLAGLDNYGGRLDTLVTMRIELGSGSSCAAPGTWTTLSDTTLRATPSTWAAGPGGWTVSGRETHPYRFTPTIAGDNAAQGSRVSADFVWEARSR
ncbi:hypothetical protein KOI35_22780 [Actinoplanes bogorensis]|uniref:Uncharacterized protein n=1 Tax=Paractinoplanes bogorensis TaxID=1610840 RepID=A0ABS5YSA6_9ACTN|nr:hypothetical protein [Actinoplanes bogorensis]MBU2666332.1 hypothetical protein [Actinoplanes bogorensis]